MDNEGHDGASADTCRGPSSRAAVAALDELRGDDTPADVAAVRNAAFRMLLDSGRPVGIDDLVEATGIASERIEEILESVRARGRIEIDGAGRLIGVGGLSLTPSRHELAIGDRRRWTWCALDAVGILGALGTTGTVTSADPHTGEIIEIEFVDGSPDTETHLFVLGGFSEGNVREDWCPRVNFFTSRAVAEAWVTANELEGDILAVTAIATEAAELWSSLVAG